MTVVSPCVLMHYCSYTEEVLPEELSKILGASFKSTMEALEKRHVSNCEALRATSGVSAAGAAAKSRKLTAKGKFVLLCA